MQLLKAGIFVFAVFSSVHAMDMTSGACEGDTCAASDDEVALLQTAVEVKELSRHGGTGTAATKATFGWTCSPLDNGALKAPTNAQCVTWAGLMSDALGKTFHCDSYGRGTYGQPGPFLRNTPQCSSTGEMWTNGGFSLNCRGHMNDGWAGPGRFIQLSSPDQLPCASLIQAFNAAMDALTAPTTTTTTTTMAPVSETPECSATPNWHAGYGSCDTYAPGLITNGAENYAYCDLDKSRTGVMASETCEECGKCYRLPSCTSVANWHAGYGSCDTYVEGLVTNGAENYAYCDLDKSRTGVMASEACEECGQCSISNPSTLASTSTSAPTRLVQEKAQKSMAEKRTRNPRRS